MIMKQKLFHIIFLITLLIASADARAWGETTSYVLTHANEEELHTISNGPAMALSGPGATLTFQARRQTLAVNYFFVQTSTDGGNSWTDLANPSLGTSYSSYSYDISIDVTHIRFITKTGATLVKYYKDVKVTRATTLATSTTELDFGTVTNRRSASLDALIDYNNTTYDQQVTGTCTDPNFTVTPTAVGAYGNNQAISIVFTPTSAGLHTGTVTLTMNGKTVTVNVRGIGQTTYYTRATASATTGGKAYVSFTSFDAATNTSDTKNSGVTTESNASTVAYYRAVPDQRYAFVGWKENLNDEDFVSTDPDFLAPAYTYNSESSTNPTVKTYYAVFEEKPNVLILEPTASDYDADLYERVTLHRTFLQGYHTLSLPFDTDVATLTGRTSDDDWVAQLSTVTYNTHDGFTLFFTKVATGRILAFQPYVLHLGQQLVDPEWTDIEVLEPQPATITPSSGYNDYNAWQMTSNFTAAKAMNGLYGIVNAAGALRLGGSGSTLNAFTAFITPPAGSAGVKAQSAFLDDDGTITAIEGLPFDVPASSSAIFTLDGIRHHLIARPGIYIIDGRKVVVK